MGEIKFGTWRAYKKRFLARNFSILHSYQTNSTGAVGGIIGGFKINREKTTHTTLQTPLVFGPALRVRFFPGLIFLPFLFHKLLLGKLANKSFRKLGAELNGGRQFMLAQLVTQKLA